MRPNLKGRVFSNETKGVMGDDGYWKLTITITERDTLDGVNWREESLSAASIDTDFDAAHRTAMRSVLQSMNDIVYARGFDSLIEAVNSLTVKPEEQVDISGEAAKSN
jgi:hypothetical protein